jgi:hypothetical protein
MPAWRAALSADAVRPIQSMMVWQCQRLGRRLQQLAQCFALDL